MPEKRITPIHYQDLVKVFERAGFTIRGKKGDHIVMTKPGVKRPVVIKTSPRLVPITHIRTNMTTAGLTREEYFRLLKEVIG
jgi:predicted RNA binding protein YcfA (HicA-like mRNA interferase family)